MNEKRDKIKNHLSDIKGGLEKLAAGMQNFLATSKEIINQTRVLVYPNEVASYLKETFGRLASLEEDEEKRALWISFAKQIDLPLFQQNQRPPTNG